MKKTMLFKSIFLGFFVMLYAIKLAAQNNVKQDIESVQFDVSKIPFSRYGAYMSLSAIDRTGNKKKDLHLNELTGKNVWSDNRVLTIEPMEGNQVISVDYEATPLSIKGKTRLGTLTIYFESPEILHITSNGPGLSLSGNFDDNNTIPVPG